MGSSLGFRPRHSALEPIAGRASPSRRAARRAWNTSDSARWGQARPTVWFMGSFLGLRAMHMALKPKTVRTAAFRLLPRTLRSRALKRPKGHGPKERLTGSHAGRGSIDSRTSGKGLVFHGLVGIHRAATLWRESCLHSDDPSSVNCRRPRQQCQRPPSGARIADGAAGSWRSAHRRRTRSRQTAP